MKLGERIFVAGHSGLVGSAIVRNLQSKGFTNLITRSHKELDLTNQDAVEIFFSQEKPDHVVLAAAKVGGIHANNIYPAEFIYKNLMIEANVIDAAFRHGVRRLLFLGSTCVYPKAANQPMLESELLTGALEPTNEPYAIAKIAGIKLCESYNRQHGTDFRSVMPTNLYGINDNFHPENSHVIPSLVHRIHEASLSNTSEVSIWGTGKPKREFLYVDDMADASIFVLGLTKEKYSMNTEPMISHINIGTGIDVSISDLAETIKNVVGYEGNIIFDDTKPDGPSRKLTDISRLTKMGWRYRVPLEQGLRITYQWYLESRKRSK